MTLGKGNVMFKELIQKGRISFHKGFDNWEDAITAACQPLITDGAITGDYIDAILRGVHEYGPYIVISPNICIPHSQEGAKGVNETAICFMKTDEAVHFSDDPEHDARLFFVLASIDNEAHMKNLQAFVEAVSDEAVVEQLLRAKSAEDIMDLN